jgi:dynein heavy chain 2, cytosolic
MSALDKVIELMNTDLNKDRAVWKTKVEEIKLMIDSMQINDSEKLKQSWKIHIDYQIFKALEYQYSVGLEKLNENLVEIKADVVYKDKQVKFSPSLEEIKSKYFTEITSFITFPLNYQGVGGKAGLFASISDRNAESLVTVYEKAEQLFEKAEGILKQLSPWTALGQVDIEGYIDEYFKTPADWENNFKKLREK